MAQRWVTEEELMQLQNKFEQGGTLEQNPLQQFFEQLPPELQKKIQMLPPEKQQEVLIQLMQRNQQASNQSVEQFPLGGLIGRRRRDDNGFDDFMKNAFYDPSGKLFLNQQSYDRYNQFLYPNQQQQSQQPYSFQIPQINIDINKFKPIFKRNHFAEGGSTEDEIPVEAERNENITTQGGEQPQVEGGYLEQQSFNPVTGQATYEIPDNKHNQTHPEGGVSMMLKEGDVVNSNKTKIPIDFYIAGKNFKGKTFKEASDFISKKEKELQKKLEELEKEGKSDKVTQNSIAIMLAKLGKERNELNELQEQVLESKKQKEANESLKSGVAEYGKVVLEMDKAEHGFNASLDRYLNYKVTDRPVLKAAEGLTASLEKFSKFADKVTSNPNSSLQDIMSAYKQSGLGNAPSFNHNSKTPVSFDYKPKNVTIPKQEIFSSIHSASNKYGIDPALMFTMADIESSFNPNATSKTEAAGLFQFTKGTGKQYGISGEKRYDLQANTDAGARLLLDNQKILIKNGIEPTPVYIYLAHQLGAEGAIELYNSITKGTPISNTTKSNMGLNFGKKSAEQYLAETTKKVMSRYDGYVTKLQQKDADLSLNAHQLKQQYQLPYQLKEIKSDLYNFGVKGITERLKANTYKPTVSNTQQQSSQFGKGGKVYAGKGNNISAYTQGDRSGLNKADYSTGDLQHIAKTYFPNQIFNSNAELQQTMLDYFIKNFGGYEDYVIPTPKGTKTGVAKPGSLVDNIFGDDWSNAIKFFTKPDTSVSVPAPTFKIDPYKNKQVITLPNNEQINIDLPSVNDDTYLDDKDDLNRNKRNSSPSDVDNSEQRGVARDLANKSDKTSWRDRLNYGMREALPYLNNLGLLMEGRIMPTFQQKPYQNPYDNLSTDVNIQSALNDIDRNTLTAMADERGNPSVRNARMSQIYANSIAGKAPLYSQKYNEEQQLTNNKVLGQGQYLNNWTDTNMNLRKRYEQEVLQTIENQRQQQHMAIDSMMNTYLRKAEEDQALKLSLMNTNWDWNKFKQELINNPEKARAEFMGQQYIAKNSPPQNNYTMSTDYYIDNKGIPRKKPSKETEDNRGKYGLKVKKS